MTLVAKTKEKPTAEQRETKKAKQRECMKLLRMRKLAEQKAAMAQTDRPAAETPTERRQNAQQIRRKTELIKAIGFWKKRAEKFEKKYEEERRRRMKLERAQRRKKTRDPSPTPPRPQTPVTVESSVTDMSPRLKRRVASHLRCRGLTFNEVSRTSGISAASVKRAVKTLGRLDEKRRRGKLDSWKPKVAEFFLDDTNSRVIPGKKSTTRLLAHSSTSAFRKFGSENPTYTGSLSAFWKAKPNNVKKLKILHRIVCSCPHCANSEFKLVALGKKLRVKGVCNLPTNVEATCRSVSCSTSCAPCIAGECTSPPILLATKLSEAQKYSEEVVSYVVAWVTQDVLFTNKKGVTKKIKKSVQVNKTAKVGEIVEQLIEASAFLVGHILRKDWLYGCRKEAAKELDSDEAIVWMDFAENYAVEYQQATEASHFSKDSITIHPCSVYLKGGETVDYVVISNDLQHDSALVFKITEKLAQDVLIPKGIKKLFRVSDGCAVQYKCAKALGGIVKCEKELGLRTQYVYLESYHGKGPIDGIGGVVKRMAKQAVVDERAVIANAEALFDFCKASQMPMRFVFLDKNEVAPARGKQHQIPLKGIRQLHQVVSSNGQLMGRKLACLCRACRNGAFKKCAKANMCPFVAFE